MSFNINEIKAQLTGGGARQSLFSVQFNNPANGVSNIKVPFMVRASGLESFVLGRSPRTVTVYLELLHPQSRTMRGRWISGEGQWRLIGFSLRLCALASLRLFPLIPPKTQGLSLVFMNPVRPRRTVKRGTLPNSRISTRVPLPGRTKRVV